MTENKWWMTIAAMCFVGCVGPADGSGEQESTGETDGDDPTVTGATETIGEDGIDARVACSEHVELTVSADELARNGRADAAVGLKLLGALRDESDNVLLSPLSLRTAFGQTPAPAGRRGPRSRRCSSSPSSATAATTCSAERCSCCSRATPPRPSKNPS